MGKHLEDAFDLPSLSDMELDDSVPSVADVTEALNQAKDLEKQFQQIDGFEQHDDEMDELAKLAVDAHKELQELGMNVEIKHAGEIFTSSSQMLRIAVDAKNNKVEKKLKLLRLQLDKLRIDRMSKSDESNVIDGTSKILDRNEILKQLRQINNEDK